jgi:hypothetical protein
MRLCALSLAALALLAACGAFKPAQPEHTARPREILDETTGNTVSVVSKPLVFARERTDVAAYARDYATLVATEIDQSGTYHDYLLLYRWSTVDRRMSPPPAQDAGELRILAEGRVFTLKPLAFMPTGLEHRRRMYLPAHGDVVAHAYEVTADMLRYIAGSRELSVQMPQETLNEPFKLWQDGRAALREFAQAAGSAGS